MAKKEERRDASCERECDDKKQEKFNGHNHDCGCHGEKDNCNCGDNCDCQKEEKHECHCGHHEHNGKAQEYLAMAQQIQADFENFRRRALDEIKQSKLAGQASVIEVFLPCLDTFKEAKKSISDEAVLAGVEMIENKINEALTTLGVEKIASIGEVYNPHLHNVIAVMSDPSKPDDVILEEYQAGYTFNGKVIRVAAVIANKC